MDQVAVLEYVFTDVYQPELSGRQTTMPPCFLAPPPLSCLRQGLKVTHGFSVS